MACKVLFCSEFPDIPEKIWQKSKRRRRKEIAKRYAFQGNAIKFIDIMRFMASSLSSLTDNHAKGIHKEK